jgi:hypothetical protein
MNKRVDFSVLDKAMKSAPMTESTKTVSSSEKKKKLIDLPIEWEQQIKSQYKGTVNGYIQMAIFERMKKDGWVD